MFGPGKIVLLACRARTMGVTWFVLVLLFDLITVPTPCWTKTSKSAGQVGYSLVVDAGSSGSRIRIYEWRGTNDCGRLPDFTEKSNHKKTPGISAFSHSMVGLEDYLKVLLDKAKEAIPQEEHAVTPLFVMATAGMRLLAEPNANAVMNKINELLLDGSFNPFRYASRNTRILSGEEEGSFAWIAVNYLQGFFADPTSESSGILELGGASTQIAFLHDGAILADKWPMKIAGRPYALYVHSYLFYGQELTVIWVKETIVRNNEGSDVLTNPCMLKGDNRTEFILGRNVTFIGSSDPVNCKKTVEDFVYKVPAYRCYPKPCAISNVYQPTVSPSKTFYALSAFLFNLQDINAIGKDGTFTPASVTQAANKYCSQTLTEAKEDLPEPSKEAFLSSNCVMGIYMPILFTKGYGFANDTKQIIAVKKLKDTPLEWTLGAVIYEHEREDRVCRKFEMGTSVSHATSSTCCSSPLVIISLSFLLASLLLNPLRLKTGAPLSPAMAAAAASSE